MAKEGGKKDQPNSHFSYKEARTLIQKNRIAAFHKKTERYNPQKYALHQLTRHETQTVISASEQATADSKATSSWLVSSQQLSVTADKRTKLLNTSCSSVPSSTEKDNKSGPCQHQWMPSYGDQPETYAWRPSAHLNRTLDLTQNLSSNTEEED